MDTQVFFEKLKQNPRPVVVDLWAPWCVPCRMIKPNLEKLAEKYAGQVDLWELNADENQGLLRELKVYGIPTLIAYDRGRETMRYIGAKPPNELGRLFETLATGKAPDSGGLSNWDRFVRLAAGSIVASLAWSGRLHWSILAFGGILMFSAVYDRCPIWKALTAQFKKVIAK